MRFMENSIKSREFYDCLFARGIVTFRSSQSNNSIKTVIQYGNVRRGITRIESKGRSIFTVRRKWCLYIKRRSVMQSDVTSRRARSFVSSTSIVASVWTVVRREWWDGFSAGDIKYSKTSNRVHIILLFHGGASRAFDAPAPRCTRVANRRIPFSYERIENICRREDQQNPCP